MFIFLRVAFCICGIFSLLACKADIVETSMDTNLLKTVLLGELELADFDAEFSMMSEYNDDTKEQINAIEIVAEKYVSIEEFDVTQGDYSLKIVVEGKIPIFYSQDGNITPDVKSPWAIVIYDNMETGSLSGYSYILSIVTTPSFTAFEAELQDISFMLSPDKFQPMKIKLKTIGNDSLKIFTGAVEVDGESKVIYESSVAKKVSLTMQDGIYDKTAPLLYFNL